MSELAHMLAELADELDRSGVDPAAVAFLVRSADGWKATAVERDSLPPAWAKLVYPVEEGRSYLTVERGLIVESGVVGAPLAPLPRGSYIMAAGGSA